MNSHTDYAAVLLRKARDHEYVVRSMSADAAAPHWIVGFHAQQAVETAIKSVLTRQAIEFPAIHNLTVLIELLQRHDLALPPKVDELSSLTPFGVALRYDASAGEDEPKLHLGWALAAIDRTLDWAAA